MIYLILIILLFYIVGVLVQMEKSCNDQKGDIPKIETADSKYKTVFALYFPGCDLLNNECLGTDCDQYFLCNDKKYSICEVYDCREEFGIGTKDKDGKIDTGRKTKDNRKKIIEIKKNIDIFCFTSIVLF